MADDGDADPYTRLIAGMTATELHGLAVECLPSELAIFDPPPGQTCGEWAGEFARLARGYLVDEAATSACGYCQYSGGDGYLEALGISFADRWRDLGIVLASTTFNVIVSCAACIYIVRLLAGCWSHVALTSWYGTELFTSVKHSYWYRVIW